MLGYTIFMKELLIKKRILECEKIKVSHYHSAIVTNSLVAKKEDPSDFSISCVIGVCKFEKSLYDLWSRINLMPSAIFDKLSLDTPLPTTIRLPMDIQSIKRSVGILHDVLVKVDKLILSAYLLILGY